MAGLVRKGDLAGIADRVVKQSARVFGGFDPENPKFYAAWEARHPERAAEVLLRALDGLPERPLVSVLTPVYNVDKALLAACIESVRAQVYTRVEHVLVDDGSPAPHIRPALNAATLRDERVRVVFREENGGISAATQTALDAAKGDFIALLDNDDALTPAAIAEMILAQHETQAEWLYSDFVLERLDGKRFSPFFKPDFSPERLMSGMYTNHLQVMRTELVRRAGGFRAGFDGAQDFDLALRLMEKTEAIAHVPKVLYHWRVIPGSTTERYDAKPYANEAAKRALRTALVRRGLAIATDHQDGRDGCDVHVEDGLAPGTFALGYKIGRGGVLGPAPKVSIIIPFRDAWDVTQRCLDSIVGKSSYLNYEIVLVDNGSKEEETRDGVERFVSHHRNAVCLRDDNPFNHSALNNLGARHATGDVLLLLNNDIEVESADWLEQMLVHAQKARVGAVGCLLLFPNRSIQHAGIVLGIGGVAGHPYKGYGEECLGYYGSVRTTANVSAVTGACLMVRKAVYDEVQGLDERELPTSYNDVDFCLRLRQKGYRNVYTGLAQLVHYESYSRGKAKDDGFRRKMQTRWGPMLTSDPYFSPNLSLEYEDYRFGV